MQTKTKYSRSIALRKSNIQTFLIDNIFATIENTLAFKHYFVERAFVVASNNRVSNINYLRLDNLQKNIETRVTQI